MHWFWVGGGREGRLCVLSVFVSMCVGSYCCHWEFIPIVLDQAYHHLSDFETGVWRRT